MIMFPTSKGKHSTYLWKKLSLIGNDVWLLSIFISINFDKANPCQEIDLAVPGNFPRKGDLHIIV